LKREGRCPSDVEHRQIKYRNNVIECDHGKLKRIIGATLGFKSALLQIVGGDKLIIPFC
ncbi:DDE-type integrase/transposase/recombinase, partial [Klebsiella pneumoniae]|nr:DDE-type integrase/transposase/recombinase [Citrobacter freundii]